MPLSALVPILIQFAECLQCTNKLLGHKFLTSADASGENVLRITSQVWGDLGGNPPVAVLAMERDLAVILQIAGACDL